MMGNVALTSKRETTARKPYDCHDCKKLIPAGSFVKRFVFKNGEIYKTLKVCAECKDYYKRKDPKYEENIG